MKKTIYIGENNLIKIKDAMADNNVSHSNSAGIPDEMLYFLLKNKPSISSRWAVVFGSIFKYFEKKSYALDYYKFLIKANKGKVKLIDLDKFSLFEENKPPYEEDEYTIGGEGGNNDFFHKCIKPFDENIERKSEKLNENTFEKWFSNSVLTDSNGKPIKMYHGTSEQFDAFSKDFIGSSGSGCYEGYGFNFTPAWSRAVSYSSGGNVIEAYLRAINPLRSDEHKITAKQLVEIIRKIDEGLPITDTLVPNYESPRYGENWDEKYYNRAVKVMAKNLIEFNYEYGDAGVYAGVCESGSADPKKVISVFEEMGYDSVIFFEDEKIKTVIVFEPNQIKRVDNKTFNIDSDAMSESINKNANFYYNEGIKPQGNVQYKEKKIGGKNILTESQESKSIAAAKKLVMQRLNYNEQEADEFIRIKLRNDIPSLRTPQGGKFILGVTRMFCDGELSTANDIGNLNSTLKLVASDAHINEYDRNLNGMSCQELVQRFAKAMSDNLEAEKAEIGQMAFDTPSDYEIVRIDSFEQAEEYGQYVSWCVTHDEDMFDSYTSNGINQFYFCLRNGFEGVKEVPSEGCPLDEYGLSMIAVSVNENGMLNTCTCRWNHDNDGDDSIMNAKEVSQVIGMNFFEVFKPNNKWKDLLTSAMQRLENGENPRNVFDDIDDFREGFASVKLNNKWNLINQEGRLLSDQWFDYASYFSEGFAEVQLNNKWNFINQEGRLISNQWFDHVDDFSEGFAGVRLNGKYNFINQEGRLLSSQWFDGVGYFSEGFAVVVLNDKWNFINQDGRLISDQWFDYADKFREGFARVKLNDKCNYINQEGRLLSNQWFDYVGIFSEGFAVVKLNGKYNFINQEGRLLSNQWFDHAYDFISAGFAWVKLNGNVYKLDTSGNLSLNESKNKNKKILVSENQLKTIKENLDLEVDSSDVDLSSFKKKHELAPNIWKPNGELNSRVRLKLLDIADDFWEFTNINWVKRKGIHLTGSICNFNWSKFSDIDLHIVVDFSEIDERKDFVQEYFNSKKNEWNNEHSKLKIYGYPVELYVEDVDAETMSGGLYDLEDNSWIKKPSSESIKQIGLDKYEIKTKSAKFMTLIDDLHDEFVSTDDDAVLREIGKKAHRLLNRIKRMRKFGLSRNGESDSLNIVYKVLRRSGRMDMLWNLSSELYDKINSIGIDESKILEIAEKFIRQNLSEEVVADGSPDHNPFQKRWKREREVLKSYLSNYGEIMTSKENGKEYKVLYDATLSSKLGINYCICIQWNSITMEPGNIIYVRAFDKFTRRRFMPQFDTRGRDNLAGTVDDVQTY